MIISYRPHLGECALDLCVYAMDLNRETYNGRTHQYISAHSGQVVLRRLRMGTSHRPPIFFLIYSIESEQETYNLSKQQRTGGI